MAVPLHISICKQIPTLRACNVWERKYEKDNRIVRLNVGEQEKFLVPQLMEFKAREHNDLCSKKKVIQKIAFEVDLNDLK